MLRRNIALYIITLLIITCFAGCADKQESKMATLDDLNNRHIGVIIGTVYDSYSPQHFPGAVVDRYNNLADLVVALKSDKIDAIITNQNSAYDVIKNNPDLGVLANNVWSIDVGVGFSKQNPALREKFNAYLKRIKADGTMDEMKARWFNDNPAQVTMPDIPLNPNGDKIKLGVAVADLPYVAYVDGKYVGFDIELLQRFAASEGYNLEIQTYEFSALIAAISSGKADIITDCIAITDERKKSVDFSDSHMQDQTAIIAMVDDLASPLVLEFQAPPMDEIAKKKIGVLQGSIHDTYMNDHYPGSEVLQYRSYPDLIQAVQYKKVDYGFMTSESFYEWKKDNPDLTLVRDNILKLPIAVGFQKGNTAMCDQFNAFLAEIKGNGVYDDMVQRWMSGGSQVMPEIPNTKANGKLVVGTVSDKGMPFTIVKDGKMIGFDVELTKRFAAYLGKDIQYMDMDFGSLIPAISGGKVEMVVSTMMVTEERAKQVQFSQPYYVLHACVFTVKDSSSSGGILQTIKDAFYRNLILENRYKIIIDGLITTALISVLAILLGTLIGALVCYMRMSRRKILQLTAKFYINLIRGIPVLVILMILFYVIFAKVDINPVLVAVIAFGVNFGAYVSEMFRTSIESVDPGQTEAGIASGFTPLQTFIHIVMPQAVRTVLPVYDGEVISLVKMTSIVGYIAVQDLTKASDIIRSRTFDAFFPLLLTAVLYFLISWLLIWMLGSIEKSTDPRRKRAKQVSIMAGPPVNSKD